MTYQEMVDYFLILQDKYGSLYYTDAEIATFLNRAQMDEVTAFLPISGDQLNIELNANTIARIAPLLFRVETLAMDVDGIVLKADLDAELTQPVMRVLAVSYNNLPVKYRRYNNWYTYLNNTFKAPSASAPKMYEKADSYVFAPASIAADLVFLGVRYPITMLDNGTVDCELPDLFHNDIVSRALSFAGVGSRDQMLSELKKLNTV